MLRRGRVWREAGRGVNVGRLQLAEQFSTMEGWQRQQDPRFDQYVAEKRQKLYFDGFDQRVERAFRVAARSHKAEVTNAFKRKVAGSREGKWTAAVMLEVKTAVEERLRWLRDVWTQIDADYRSGDAERQATAAREIADALRGEPGAYMQWVYEQKRDRRFAGSKEAAAQTAERSAAELPEVSEDEANRYHSLPMRMADIEYNVKTRFGIAGQQHWAELQAAKDASYEEKLDTAAKVYEKLLDQSARFDESRRTALLRSNVERVHQAQVRFTASMEMEKERERLVEAHAAMREERAHEAKAARVAILRDAAELRQSGATAETVALFARQQKLESHARRQAEYQLREREALQQKKTHYLDMIEQFKSEVERREGQEMLQQQQQQSQHHGSHRRGESAGDAAPRPNAFGFMEADRLDETTESRLATSGATSASASLTPADRDRHVSSPSPSTTTTAAAAAAAAPASRTRELWRAIDQDRYEDPFLTVHQARLDAAATYDPLYSKNFGPTLAQGRRYSRQGLGELAAGGGMDRHVFKATAATMRPYQWGVASNVVHDLDADGSKDYFVGPDWHVRHPTTGDIDWRYERKRGGAIFRGPLLYGIGAARDAADPGNATMDPSVTTATAAATVRRFSPSTNRSSATAAALPSRSRRAGDVHDSRGRRTVAPNRRLTKSATTPTASAMLPKWRST